MSTFEFWDPCESTVELALVETAASSRTLRTFCIMVQRTRCLGLQIDQPSRIEEKLVLMQVSTIKVAIDRLVIFNQPHLEAPPILYIHLKFREMYDFRFDQMPLQGEIVDALFACRCTSFGPIFSFGLTKIYLVLFVFQ